MLGCEPWLFMAQGKQKKNPRFLKSGSIGIVRITVEESVAIESYKQFPQLGRFTIRDEGQCP